MKLILPLLFLLFFSAQTFSQTEKSSAKPMDLNDNPEQLKSILDNSYKINSFSVKVSEYYGLEAQILNILADKVIPLSCPKTTSGGYSDKSKYIADLNIWLDKNQALVKSDKKNSLITE